MTWGKMNTSSNSGTTTSGCNIWFVEEIAELRDGDESCVLDLLTSRNYVNFY